MHTLVPAIDHQIKILKEYRQSFLNHAGYFENEKNDSNKARHYNINRTFATQMPH